MDEGLLHTDVTKVGAESAEPGVHIDPRTVSCNYPAHGEAVAKVVNSGGSVRWAFEAHTITEPGEGLADILVDERMAPQIDKKRCFRVAGHASVSSARDVASQCFCRGLVNRKQA